MDLSEFISNEPLTYEQFSRAKNRFPQPRRSRAKRDPVKPVQQQALWKPAKAPLTKPHGLVLVPFLHSEVLQSELNNAVVIPEADAIEDILSSLQLPQQNDIAQSSLGPHRTFREIRMRFRSPKNSNVEPPDISMFRVVKKHQSTKVAPSLRMTRDGFEDSELELPPKVKAKRSPRATVIVGENLLLARIRGIDQLSSSLSLSDVVDHQPFGFSALSLTSSTARPNNYTDLECTLEQTSLQVGQRGSSNSSPQKISTPNRRVSFSNEVMSQLVHLTAPARSQSESDDEKSGDSELDTEQAEEEGHDESNTLFQPTENIIEDDDSLLLDECQAPEDPIEDNELLLQERRSHPTFVDVHLNRLGQVGRVKPSGQWDEVQEEIIDIESPRASRDVVGGAPTKRFKSILKKPSHTVESYRSDNGMHADDICKDTPNQIATESSGYFSQAADQLSSLAQRRHSIVPCRYATTTSPALNDENNDEDDSVMSGYHTNAIHMQATYFPSSDRNANSNRPSQESSIKTRSPVRDLKTLVRTTSQEFGTTSARPRLRMPSLPFNPPFIKGATKH